MNWQPVAFKAVVDQLGKVAADLTAHQHTFEETFRSAAEAAKYFSLANERLRNTNKNLSGHGFFLFPYLDDFDISDIDRLAEFSATELAAFFTETFRANDHWHLRHIFDKQRESPYLVERRALLDKCIMAHTLKMYGLTIPALLPVIENIILRLLGLPPDVGTLRQRLEKNRHRGKFSRYVPQVDFCSGMLFEQFVFDVFGVSRTTNNILLRRNGILHGYEVRYATELNSLFLFFALNFLFEIRPDQTE